MIALQHRPGGWIRFVTTSITLAILALLIALLPALMTARGVFDGTPLLEQADAQACYVEVEAGLEVDCQDSDTPLQDGKCYVWNNGDRQGYGRGYSEVPCPVPADFVAGRDPVCTVSVNTGAQIDCPSQARAGRCYNTLPRNGLNPRACTVLDHPDYNPGNNGGNTGGAASSTPPVCYSRSNDVVDCPSSVTSNTANNGRCFQQPLRSDTFAWPRISCSTAAAAAAEPDEVEDTGEETVSCEEQSGALGWIACPIILALDSAFNWIDTQIQNLLSIKDDKYKDDRLYRAWAQIRNISYAILIPIMLVMVIGTAIGVEAFSAYTVKRALPRMVAAVIFITLSWYIVGFIINFFNVVGAGVMGIMTFPFTVEVAQDGQIIEESVSTMSLGDLFSATGQNFLDTMVAQIGTTIGVLILLIFFLPSVVGILLIAFGLLLFRQILIVALMILAPLAILAWIFPSNDKLWKLWWGTFSKLLMMFPIIMAVLAVGRIFAVIILSDANGGTDSVGESIFDSILAPLAAVIAYVIPYAFIPFTFRLAGGFFATLTGMVNDRSKGFFDGQREKRAAKLKRFQNEKVFSGDGRLAKFGNKAATWGVAPHKNAALALGGKRIPFVSSYGRRLGASIHGSAVEQTGNFFKKLNTEIGENDKAYRVLGGMDAGLSETTRRRLESAGLTGPLTTERKVMAAAEILKNGTSQSEREAGSALERAATVIGSRGYDPETHYASVAGAAALGLAAHGFFGDADVRSARRSMIAETNSGHFADSMMIQSELYAKDSMPHMKPGYGHDRDYTLDEEDNMISGVTSGRDMDVLATFGAAEIGKAKGGFFDDMDSAYNEVLAYESRDPALQAALAQRDLDDAARLAQIKNDVAPSVEREFGARPADAAGAERWDALVKEAAYNTQEGRLIKRRETAKKNSRAVKETLLSVASGQSYANAGAKERSAALLEKYGLQDELRNFRGSVNPGDDPFLNPPPTDEGGPPHL